MRMIILAVLFTSLTSYTQVIDVGGTAQGDISSSLRIPATPQPQPKPKVFDAEFKTLLITDMLISFGDATVSATVISNNPNKKCYETDPLFGGNQPSKTRFYVQSLATSAGFNLLGYIMKRHHSRIWGIPAGTDAILHFSGMVNTIDLSACR